MTANETGPSIIPRLMTVAAASAELQCNPETIRRAIRARQLACYRLGGLIRVTPEQLVAHVESTLRPAHDPQGKP